MCLFYFCCSSSSPHRDLHSFPTRRSSDLDNVPGFTGVISDLGGPTANMYRLACKSREIESACRRPSCVRSEEHTTELQSRPHLVCRLLFEKKKTSDNHKYYAKIDYFYLFQ